MRKKSTIFILMIVLSSLLLAYFTFLGGSKYDINSMSESEALEKLITLSSIGETRAELIIKNRPYYKLEDITLIKGIGEETYLKVKKYFKVSGVK